MFKGEKKYEFASRIGANPVQLSRYLNGMIPKHGTIIKISLATGASSLWFLTGRGPREGPPLPPSMIDNIMRDPDQDPGDPRELLDQMTVRPQTAARILGLKTARQITDADRVELAVSHLLDMDLNKEDRDGLADMVRDLAGDPVRRRAVLDFWQYQIFKGGKKK